MILNLGDRPVILMGHGVRASGAPAGVLTKFGVPLLSSWQAADLVDNNDPMYFGRPGIFGQRCANRVLYEADTVISLGCRLTPWMIGHAGLRPEQKLIMVDVDGSEVARFPQAQWINQDVREFIKACLGKRMYRNAWVEQCNSWREQYPWIESPTHDDTPGFINSYRVIQKIEELMLDDEIVVTDVGSNMCTVFQAMHFKPPQRCMTSGGLGEMGCGLPAAIGASFAADHKRVLAIVGDGGLMMNLQEMQTIMHHRLPIKIFVFANDGYAMIKGTHKNLKIPYIGVDAASGVSMPDFAYIAESFGMKACDVYTWGQLDDMLQIGLRWDGPFLWQIHIDPEQVYAPRLQPIIAEDGTITPPKFYELSP